MAASRSNNRSKPGRSKARTRSRRRSTGTRFGIVPFILTLGVIGAVLVAGAIWILPGGVDRAIQEVALPLRHEDIIRQQAEDKNVDASLIAAVIYSESRFVDQTSHAKARGLMQITPETANDIERRSGGTSFNVDDLSDPDINIRYGTFFLKELIDTYDGNLVAALAAYNAGPGNADSWGGAAMTVEDIQFPETRAYVDQVLQKKQEYRKTYAGELGY